MHGIIVNLPSGPSSESEASDEIHYEQKVVSHNCVTRHALHLYRPTNQLRQHDEPVFASVRKMSLQPSECSSDWHTPRSHHALLECPDLISNRQHSSSPETVPQPRTPIDTPALLPSALVFVPRYPPPMVIPMPVVKRQPVRSLEAMIVINLAQIKVSSSPSRDTVQRLTFPRTILDARRTGSLGLPRRSSILGDPHLLHRGNRTRV